MQLISLTPPIRKKPYTTGQLNGQPLGRSWTWTTCPSFVPGRPPVPRQPSLRSAEESALFPSETGMGIQDETPLKAPRTLKPQGPNTEYICMKDHSL